MGLLLVLSVSCSRCSDAVLLVTLQHKGPLAHGASEMTCQSKES